MAQYTATGVIFAKATERNLNIARSSNGGAESDITERINPVTLAQGLITTSKAALTGTFSSVTNTNEINGSGTNFDPQLEVGDRLYFLDGTIYKLVGTIAQVNSDTKVTLVEAAPVNTPTLGDALAKNTNVITGVNTQFLNDYVAGDYLFYFDASGVPILIGQIATVSDAQLVLEEKATVDVVNKSGGKVNVVVNGAESFLIRIPVVANSNGVFLPNWDSFRISATPTSYNDTTVSSIATYSLVGNPAVIGSTTQAPFTITPTNLFQTYAQPTSTNPQNRVLWPSPNPVFPNFIFALINPYGAQADVNLAQNTMYQFECVDTISGFLTGANTPVSTMLENGYSESQFATSAGPGTGTGGQQ